MLTTAVVAQHCCTPRLVHGDPELQQAADRQQQQDCDELGDDGEGLRCKGTACSR
jgi:hypothetical protein